jgi:hypothetical protein
MNIGEAFRIIEVDPLWIPLPDAPPPPPDTHEREPVLEPEPVGPPR